MIRGGRPASRAARPAHLRAPFAPLPAPAKIMSTCRPPRGRHVEMRGKVTLLAAALALSAGPAPAQKERPPHGQDTMPGPALSPQEAIRKMRVPPGFHVELVTAEPDIVNPVAMT